MLRSTPKLGLVIVGKSGVTRSPAGPAATVMVIRILAEGFFMCSACGYPAAPGHWTEAGAANISDRLRSRFRRAEVLQRVLSPYGLKAYDGGLVPGIQISNQFGNQAIARDLAEVWAISEQWIAHAIDPLDPRFTDTTEKAV